MKQEQSKKDELEIKKAPEELTEQDLEKVAGGRKTCSRKEGMPKCPGDSF